MGSALYYNRKRKVEFLLRRGADPSACNPEGSTPLSVARDRDEEVQDLVEVFLGLCDDIHGGMVRIDARDSKDETPLPLALSRGHRNLVNWLLRRGANPNLPNEGRDTALHIICNKEEEAYELAEVFFETNEEKRQPVRIDSRNVCGHTPLHRALIFFFWIRQSGSPFGRRLDA
ncbi:unnamed protein product [Trichogramma brassicae]|uniref:Uncharacterized protein n=1 Tax=Trichogramma brassicae TaxID=86971 RepID=A0A6H5HX97_9HYME|nr:unnamed protein product [Trichogramma brassicae]